MKPNRAIIRIGFLFSGFELFSEEDCGGLHKFDLNTLFLLGYSLRGRIVRFERNDATEDVALRDDRHCAGNIVRAVVFDGSKLCLALAVELKLAALDNDLKLGRDVLFGILLLRHTRSRDHGVTVADENVDLARLVEGICILRGKCVELSDGGIFLKDDLALAVGVYLKRIAVTDNIDTENLIALIFSALGCHLGKIIGDSFDIFCVRIKIYGNLAFPTVL